MAGLLLTRAAEEFAMDAPQKIMVVTDAPALVNALSAWLSPEAYNVTAVATFAAAKAQLQNQPNLVITQLRLGQYNGLHIALRARSQGIPTVVIGDPDPVLERDALELGATYVTTDALARDQVLSLARQLMTPAPVDPDCQHCLVGVSSAAPNARERWNNASIGASSKAST